MNKKTLIDNKSFSRILRRISHEIIEKNKGAEGIIFLGVLTRGYPIAKRIADNIYNFEDVKLPCYHLDISDYRDDRISLKKSIPTNCNIDINGKKVIIVDDVISTGRTVRAAMDAINTIGRPSKIELVAIVDRGHRELPIKPDFIGKNIPTSKDEFVLVEIKEIDGQDLISIKYKD